MVTGFTGDMFCSGTVGRCQKKGNISYVLCVWKICIKVHLSICIYIFLFIDAPNVFLAMWGNWLATVKQWFTCPALFTNFPEIVLKLLDLKPVNLRKKVRMKQDLCWSPLFVIQYPLQPCYVCKLWPVDHEALPALHHPQQKLRGTHMVLNKWPIVHSLISYRKTWNG